MFIPKTDTRHFLDNLDYNYKPYVIAATLMIPTAYTFKLRPNWDNMKVQVMRDVLRIKFSAEPLRSWLIATENDELIEGNDHGDEFWGVCDGVGENYLGNLLMELRSELAGVK